jgi:hypothetical protein
MIMIGTSGSGCLIQFSLTRSRNERQVPGSVMEAQSRR